MSISTKIDHDLFNVVNPVIDVLNEYIHWVIYDQMKSDLGGVINLFPIVNDEVYEYEY